MTRLAALTLAHRRHDHLRGQIAGLAHGQRLPDLHVVVAMDDDEIEGVARRAWDDLSPGTAADAHPVELVVVRLPADPRGLPLAAARNAAAGAAIDRGAEHLVFIDVDCIPGPTTLAVYDDELARGAPAPALLGGDVGYLPALTPDARPWDFPRDLSRLPAAAEHRPDRVRLLQGQRQGEADLTRFWSLSFAMRAADLQASGGFCPDYVGYGGEDTDFAVQVGARGGSLTWVGGATAYHQHHPTHSPPLDHLEEIVRNANVFATRWGWWPMEGWLERFRDLGLATTEAGGRWVVTR